MSVTEGAFTVPGGRFDGPAVRTALSPFQAWPPCLSAVRARAWRPFAAPDAPRKALDYRGGSVARSGITWGVLAFRLEAIPHA